MLAFDRVYTYEEIEQLILAAADEHPDLCKTEKLAETPEGRAIWGVTLSMGTDDPSSRPGFYVQGGLHADEGMGITESLVLLYTLLEDDKAREILNRVTVYILPCINPDGSNACVTTGRSIRSQSEFLPDNTPNALIPQDLNGDGRISSMRWQDPTGRWKCVDGCGDIMIAREIGDTEGPFYNVIEEGIIANYDGSGSLKRPRSLDMNRQFAEAWKDSPDGGDYPGRHVESRTVMEFLLTHPNIFAAFDIHCGSRAIIYGLPTNGADANLINKMIKTGEEITGITPILDINYHRVNGNPPKSRPGVFRGYAQNTFGIPTLTVELGNGWTSIGMKSVDIFNAPGGMNSANLIKKIVALHEKHNSKISVPWQKYNHPQLGEVEIGGRLYGNAYLMLMSDMIELLPKVTEFLTKIMEWYPKLELVNVECKPLGGDVVRVRADVINTGLMNTAPIVSSTGYHAKVPVYVTLSGAKEFLNRYPTNEFTALAPIESRKLEWFVRAEKGSELTITASQAKSAGASVTVTVE